MDSTTLVDEKKKAGDDLLGALDRTGFPIESAFWYQVPDGGGWRLILASPLVREKGPDFAYRKIQEALSALNSNIQTTDIWLVKETEPIVVVFKQVFPEAKNLTVGQTSAAGLSIGGAHIYRSTSS